MSLFSPGFYVPTAGAKITTVNDALSGGAKTGVAGIQTARSPGQLGAIHWLSQSDAVKQYGATMYGGLFQYVKVLSTATIAPAAGQLAFWGTLANSQAYVVTTDASATIAQTCAGVFLGAPTKGNYCWIQVAGIAQVLFGTLTKTTPVVGDTAVASTSTGKADVLADATAWIGSNLRLIIGTSLDTAVTANTISPVLLKLDLIY